MHTNPPGASQQGIDSTSIEISNSQTGAAGQSLAEPGSREVLAQMETASQYLCGDSSHITEGLPWLRAAAQNGLQVARLELAYAYLVGDYGLQVDPAQAAQWHQGEFPRPDICARFTEVENRVISEASSMFFSSAMHELKASYQAGESFMFKFNGRIVQYEPDFPFSGMTIFEENAFILGRHALSSDDELKKTLLHELFRLNHSAIKTSGGVSGAQASSETRAAFEFSERAASRF